MAEEVNTTIIEEIDNFEEIDYINNPQPVRIVESDGFGKYFCNKKFLKEFLLESDNADKKVAIVSVAGAYRKGKSFLLNFFLRYLKSLNTVDLQAGRWMETEDSLKGFSWRGGSERDTSGILFWSQPFLLKDKNGEEIVIILMDTQGAFDTQSTVKDNATIFALSTMIAATQIFNISQNIQEDDLQHLQLFTEYGKLALEESFSKPFQHLLFLVRDWSYPYEAEYGFEGGKRVLESRLHIDEKQHHELRQIREQIHECFEKMECFLMPHPGLKVATNPNFKGHLNEIDGEFKSCLETFIEHIFDSNNIIPKSINGSQITCRELYEYLICYTEIFGNDTLPEPKSMLVATAEANNRAAVEKARMVYVKEMEEICGGGTPYMQSAELEKEHERVKNSAIECFKRMKKMGGKEFSEEYIGFLENGIEMHWEAYQKVNASKNLFKSMKTPTVLVALLIMNYVGQEIFQLIGIELFASIFTTLLFIIIIVISVWTYSRYSGTLRTTGQQIDDGVLYLWENFLSPISKQGISTAADIAIKMNTTSSDKKRN
ncbi:Atlastin [Strongyloides ratti]|uniref:Atlastin n=1 Tax=Strongyloides ratti TaxID=34506 RepID=A0A090LNV9_STRRB|nr:Atlastin [Strongyloides ratti]CEF69874.1 Atlastin [Strongyloides ratti]